MNGQKAPEPVMDSSGVSNDNAAPQRKPERLVSLDAYRGFIMIMLAAAGFGIIKLAHLPESAPAWQTLDYAFWQRLSFNFDHPAWISQFHLIGIAFWDLIQPSFMFMVGVAMPYSYARRAMQGQSASRRFMHALWRGVVLVLLGVFIQSARTSSTNWIFTNVLSQIGLGYVVLYLLMRWKFRVQLAVFIAILVGYWLFFAFYKVPENYDFAAVKATGDTIFEGRFAPWSKNANIAYRFDCWLLNLFPRPAGKEYLFNGGGYVTLNFVPSIATMLLGVFCGQLLRGDRAPRRKFGLLVATGAVCMVLGVMAGALLCPIVKRIWTPSWVLFSGAYVIWMLAAFYLVFDLLPLKRTVARRLAFPLVVVGMNSIAVYMMGSLMRPWTVKMIHTHFGRLLEGLLGSGALDDKMFGRLVDPTTALIVFWLIAYWMYRKKIFIRV